MRSSLLFRPTSILILVAIAAGILAFLPQMRVNANEAQALWVVRDHAAPDADFTTALRTNLYDFLDRVREQPQPPLYFISLEGWTLLFGHDIIAARMLSLLFGGVALLFMALAGRKLVPGVPTWIWLIFAAAVAIYPATQAYVYGWLLLTMALSTWALVRWRDHPSLLHGGFYMLTFAAVLYTAHVAIFAALLHLIYAYKVGMMRRVLIAIVLAEVLFSPWLVLFQSREMDALLAIDGLITITLTWLVVALPFIVAALGWLTIAEHHRMVYLPVGMVLVSAVVTLAWMASAMGEPEAVMTIRAERDDTEPALIHFAPNHPLNYYDTHEDTQLSSGISIDLAWRKQTSDTLSLAITAVQGAPAVWVMLPEDDADTRIVIDRLSAERERSYERLSDGMIFARFDRADITTSTTER